MPATWNKLAFDADVVKHSLATAASDFLVASGAGAFIKKTLAEARTILSLPALNYAVGDLLYASSTTMLSKLADVAVGSVLVSGGIGAAPAWSAAPSLTTSLTVPLIIAPAAALAIKPTTDATTAIQLQDKDGNSILNVDTTNNRVGIGSGGTAPDVDFHIKKTGATDNAILRIETTSLGGYGAQIQFKAPTVTTDVVKQWSIGTGVMAGINSLEFYNDSINTNVLELTLVGNVSIGGAAVRGTTVGTKALQIFDGTAPAGTLTNGCSIFSTGGALGFMDSAGNAMYFDMGRLGIGVVAPDAKLQVHDGSIYLSDTDVAHGMISYVPTDVFGGFSPHSSTSGGLRITGFSDTDWPGMLVYGVIGATSPTNPAVVINGAKKDGTACQAMGSTEQLLQVWNDGSAVLTILGSGSVGIGVTNFGTSAAKVLGIGSGTAPTTSPADMAQAWVEDIDGAGTAGFKIRTEDGLVIPLGRGAVYTIPATDLTAQGDIITMTVDTNAEGIGAPLFMAADGHLDTADADASTTAPCVALALETGTGSKKILLRGVIRNDAWNWTIGPGRAGLIFLSTTVGTLMQTADFSEFGTDDVLQVVGFALSADAMYFNPQYNYITKA